MITSILKKSFPIDYDGCLRNCQRGQFDKALGIYVKLTDKKLQYIVEQGVTWTIKKQKRLMVIKSKEQFYADYKEPIMSSEKLGVL
jgi:hypothetical protein